MDFPHHAEPAQLTAAPGLSAERNGTAGSNEEKIPEAGQTKPSIDPSDTQARLDRLTEAMRVVIEVRSLW